MRIKTCIMPFDLAKYILTLAVQTDRHPPEHPTMKGRQNARLL